MYLGFLVSMAVASQMPAFGPVFRGSSAPLGVVLGATVIFGVGLSDDMREMSPPAKLAGQVLAGTVLYFFGVDMLFFHVPLAQTTVVLSPDLAVLATVLWVAVMANSVNFIDGLDGLAAGIVAIGAGAFFIYAHQLGDVGNISSGNAGPLIAVIAVGICVGFQLLYEGSEEDRSATGLGILPGVVRRLPAGVKHPQMQWNVLEIGRSDLLAGVPDPAWVYFVQMCIRDRS